VFVTEVESVYCAVRTESLYKTDTLRLYGLTAMTVLNSHSLYSTITEKLQKCADLKS
jgi:hypothetical protein